MKAQKMKTPKRSHWKNCSPQSKPHKTKPTQQSKELQEQPPPPPKKNCNSSFLFLLVVGHMTYFLGLEVQISALGIFLNKYKYTNELRSCIRSSSHLEIYQILIPNPKTRNAVVNLHLLQFSCKNPIAMRSPPIIQEW